MNNVIIYISKLAQKNDSKIVLDALYEMGTPNY